MRNERRTLGSERGYGKPMAKRSHGARSLLYSLTIEESQNAPLAGVIATPDSKVGSLRPQLFSAKIA